MYSLFRFFIEKPAVLVALVVVVGFVIYLQRPQPKPVHYDPWAKSAPQSGSAAEAGADGEAPPPDVDSH